MTNSMTQFLNFDELAKVITLLIMFIGMIVAIFAKNYLKGDKKYVSFFINLFLLVSSLILLVASDNLMLFACFWFISNYLLFNMMIHKKQWQAAYNSGILAAKHFLLGFVCLVIAFVMIHHLTGETSIKALSQNDAYPHNLLTIPLLLILITAMTQSAIWPFNSWLMSSLNSPTPVSAIMHAGLVNGGGILLARFAHLYFHHSEILKLIFIIGILTSVIATVWKLIQSDIKKMLACSTVAQMGFMFAQVGLGLFPAAIAHLFWHGMFKSYLFLSANSAWKEKRINNQRPVNLVSFFIALAIGSFGAMIFTKGANLNAYQLDSTIVIIFLAFIASAQIALVALEKINFANLVSATFIVSIASFIYAKSVYLVEYLLFSLDIFKPQKFDIIHLIAMTLIFAIWVFKLFAPKLNSKKFAKLYVQALNASQPKPETITTNRNQYKYN